MKLNIVRIVLIIIILFITSTIFSFSNQDSEESSSVSGKVAKFVVDVVYKDISDEERGKLVESYQHPIRKLAHFSIYTALGISVSLLMCTYKIEDMKKIVITLLYGALYAASDEIHQLFIPGRSRTGK